MVSAYGQHHTNNFIDTILHFGNFGIKTPHFNLSAYVVLFDALLLYGNKLPEKKLQHNTDGNLFIRNFVQLHGHF